MFCLEKQGNVKICYMSSRENDGKVEDFILFSLLFLEVLFFDSFVKRQMIEYYYIFRVRRIGRRESYLGFSFKRLQIKVLQVYLVISVGYVYEQFMMYFFRIV